LRGALIHVPLALQSEVLALALDPSLQGVFPTTRSIVIDRIERAAINDQHINAIDFLLAKELQGDLATAVLRAGVIAKSANALSILNAEVAGGNWWYFLRTKDLVSFDLTHQIAVLKAILGEIKQPTVSLFSEGARQNLVKHLVHLNIEIPGHADWATVVKFLIDIKIDAKTKSPVCMVLVAEKNQLPGEVADSLVAASPALAESRYIEFWDGIGQESLAQKATDLANLIHYSFGNAKPNEFCGAVTRLLSANVKHRIRALQLLHYCPVPELASAVLLCLGDVDFGVRVNAASAVGRYAREGLIEPAIGIAVEKIAECESANVCFAFLGALHADQSKLDHRLLEPILRLSAHAAHSVRTLAQELQATLIEARRKVT